MIRRGNMKVRSIIPKGVSNFILNQIVTSVAYGHKTLSRPSNDSITFVPQFSKENNAAINRLRMETLLEFEESLWTDYKDSDWI